MCIYSICFTGLYCCTKACPQKWFSAKFSVKWGAQITGITFEDMRQEICVYYPLIEKTHSITDLTLECKVFNIEKCKI